MSRKNFTVATTEDGKTTLTKIDKTPTGKTKTLKDKNAIKAAREEQYKNFRINALKRRAKRMGLGEEEIQKKVEELIKQIEAPNQYSVLIMYNPDDADLMKQALKNEGMVADILTTTYLFIIADSETLGTLRSIAPPSAKIYPHVKRKPPILPVQTPSGRGKKTRTKAEKKNLAAAAKKARKAAKALKSKKERNEAKNKANRKAKKAKTLFDKRCLKAQKSKAGTTVQLKAKKGSTASKKASTDLKQAA